MKASLKPGLTHRLLFRVPEDKTVPYLYPQIARLQRNAEGFRDRLHGRAVRMGLH